MKTLLLFPARDVICQHMMPRSPEINRPLLKNDLCDRIGEAFANRILSPNEARRELSRVLGSWKVPCLYSVIDLTLFKRLRGCAETCLK